MGNENFDRDKWKRDNPINYIKMVNLILTSTNKDFVFRELYKITRLYIPDTLYKYYSLTDDKKLNSQKFNTLRKKAVYLANTKDFNDPYDNKGFYYKNEELNQFDELKKYNGHIFDDVMYSSMSSSFTESGVENMPMWAHYSNNHEGYCVSYCMNHAENSELKCCMLPIQYIDRRIDITDIMVSYIKKLLDEKKKQSIGNNKEILINDISLVYIICLLSNIKQINWKYEKEFRCSARNTTIGMPFMKAIPKEIYVGYKCSSDNIKHLMNIASELSIPIYKMKLDESNSEYKLIKTELHY